MPANRAVKPKPAVKRTARAWASKALTREPSDEEATTNELHEAEGAPDTQAAELIQFEKKSAGDLLSDERNSLILDAVKELKKTTPTQNYATVFSRKVESEQEQVFSSLAAMRNKSTKKSTDFKDAFSHLVNQSLGAKSSSIDISDLSKQHPLYLYQLSLLSLATGLTSAHKPLRDTLRRVVDEEMPVGDTWKADEEEAVRVVRKTHAESSDRLESMLKAGSHSRLEGSWGQAVMKSRRNVKKALKHVPMPEDMKI